MELITTNIHSNRQKCKSNLQMNLNDDVNVPDAKPDIASILKISGEITTEEQKILSGKYYVKGFLQYRLLYLSAESDQQIHCISGRLSFEDTIHLEEECSAEQATLHSELEELSANLINSRKISIKSLLHFQVDVDELYDEIVCNGINSPYPLCLNTEPLRLTGLAVSKKDSYRYRDEITLPASKNNIDEVLYQSIALKNIDIRIAENQFSLKGDLSVFLLYSSDDSDAAVEYYETDLPFHTVIECNGCKETMTPDISVTLVDKGLEIRQDNEGEPRIVSLEALMELQIRIYEEISCEMVRDVYSPSVTLTPIYRPAEFETLLIHNSNKAKISDHIKLNDSAPKALQICHGSGTVRPEHIAVTEDGLLISGILDTDIFYMTSDDTRPMYTLHTPIPFRQLIEVPNISKNVSYTVKPDLEQLTVLLSEADDFEIKATLLLNCLVFEKKSDQLLIEVKEEPLDYTSLVNSPGMIGYTVQPDDDLWSIAKRYHTTTDSIIELNELETKQPPAGTRLLLIKELPE